jgi:aryl-alcohol dehydrogenase-like predicted oxidoreductase
MKIALGSAQFGMKYGINNTIGQVNKDNVKKILNYASNTGIDTIDTAIAYGNSEEVLGKIGVSGFKVISKLPNIPVKTNIYNWMLEVVNGSISRLKSDNLYGLMLHNPTQLLESDKTEIISSLQKLRDLGMVKKIGVSVYSVSEIEPLFNLFQFDIIQCPFNLIDRSLVESGCSEKLKKLGVEIHTRSSFLQGLLIMPRDKIPKNFQKWDLLWDTWHTWLKKNNISAVEACVAYSLSHLDIDRVIFGVDSASQLKEIVEFSNKSSVKSYPDIADISENLINPSKWSNL